jgi:hypothetical protein
VAQRPQHLKVDVPSKTDESVRFGRVGVIAVVGFTIGMLWPHLAGVRLVPSVPTPGGSADLSGAPASEGSTLAPAAEPVAPAAEQQPEAPRLTVGELQIATCRSKSGKRQETCDPVDFDRVARSHLESLGRCEGSDELDGVLSLGFELDFTSERIKAISSGKSTSLEQKQVDLLLKCAKKEFENVSLTSIPHEHAHYLLFYRLEFSKRAEPAEAVAAEPGSEPAGEGEVTEASGRATVAWDVALIRSAPSLSGCEPRGSRAPLSC